MSNQDDAGSFERVALPAQGQCRECDGSGECWVLGTREVCPECNGSGRGRSSGAPDSRSAPLAGEVLVEVGKIFDSYISEAGRVKRECILDGLKTTPVTMGLIGDLLIELRTEVVEAIKRRTSVASRVLSEPGSDKP